MNVAFLSLGSNIGDREQNLRDAVSLINKTDEIEVVNISSIYETDPVGYTNQAQFLNIVVKVNCALEAEQLLSRCMEIEQYLGRVREFRWGPRCIDLDILMYNEDNIVSENLVIPHPRMHERGFVLVPLVEVDESLLHPESKVSLQDYMDKTREGVHLWKKIESVIEFVHSGN